MAKPSLGLLIGMGKPSGESEPGEEAPEESGEEMAMRAFAKALRGDDSAEQLDAFRMLLEAVDGAADEEEPELEGEDPMAMSKPTFGG